MADEEEGEHLWWGWGSSDDDDKVVAGRVGWATAAVFLLVLLWHLAKHFFFYFFSSSSSSNRRSSTGTSTSSPTPSSTTTDSNSSSPPSWISEILSEADLRRLITCLDGEVDGNEKWEHVISKRNSHLSYQAKCCKPKDGPLKYLSSTVYESCSPDVLKDFYMDNDFRKQWDKTFLEHEQLHIDVSSGIEIGRIIKRFPLLRPREYVMAWKVWEGNNKVFYCIAKECEHPLAPRQSKYVRVEILRSGWRIRKVPGTNACEINMVHQEDAGLNEKMAKVAFARGIWSYVCEMDSALRKYSSSGGSRSGSLMTAVTLIQKVPSELEVKSTAAVSKPTLAAANDDHGEIEVEGRGNARKVTRRPSMKLVANSLLLVGGLICLTHGNPSLGAKVAAAYILNKLSKRAASPCHGETQA
ncbi:hypothetical protein Dimus_027315 [Dionaea muscipula]